MHSIKSTQSLTAEKENDGYPSMFHSFGCMSFQLFRHATAPGRQPMPIRYSLQLSPYPLSGRSVEKADGVPLAIA